MSEETLLKIHKKREYRERCEECSKISKVYRMLDIDGTNLVEYLVCLKCGSETLALV